jgi:precorrin-2 dehydrogenase / sirohydrochlorin ferrochelatase
MAGYPITLELKGRRVAVIGLGRVGQRKVEGLLNAGADIIGVDPLYPGDRLASLIDYRAEVYQIYHLQDILLAFAAATPEVNGQIVEDAKQMAVLVNSASNPDIADFTIPAIWRNGGVLMAVSTNGASPALSGMLRDRAASAIGEAAAGLAELLRELRPHVLARVSDPEARGRIFTDWGNPRWIDVYLNAGAEGVRDELERRLAALCRDQAGPV